MVRARRRACTSLGPRHRGPFAWHTQARALGHTLVTDSSATGGRNGGGGMAERYQPRQIEPKWQQRWEADRLYEAEVDPSREKYSG